MPPDSSRKPVSFGGPSLVSYVMHRKVDQGPTFELGGNVVRPHGVSWTVHSPSQGPWSLQSLVLWLVRTKNREGRSYIIYTFRVSYVVPLLSMSFFLLAPTHSVPMTPPPPWFPCDSSPVNSVLNFQGKLPVNPSPTTGALGSGYTVEDPTRPSGPR